MNIKIRPLTLDDTNEALAHFSRHKRESGQNDVHFMPFSPSEKDEPMGINVETLDRPLTARGWQRWFLAFDANRHIIGHVNLKSDALKTGLHRCELGIGIEQKYRGDGLGKRLMLTAIEFANNADSLSWIDLRVFAHNTAARALYQSLGFNEVGTLVDRFRIDGQQTDDVIMVLPVE